MDTQRTSAPVSTKPGVIRVGAPDVAVIKAREPSESAIPNAAALSAINRSIIALTQQMMELVAQRPERWTAARAEDMLSEAKRQLAAIRQRSSANPRVRAGLDGARTALQTAAREVRDHLIRHGYLVDDIGD